MSRHLSVFSSQFLVFRLPDSDLFQIIDHLHRLTDEPTVSQVILFITVEVYNLITVQRESQICLPCEVLLWDVHRVQTYFHPFIGGRSYILKDRAITVEVTYRTGENQIFRSTVIHINRTVDTIIQEAEINTVVPLRGHLPTKIFVTFAVA